MKSCLPVLVLAALLVGVTPAQAQRTTVRTLDGRTLAPAAIDAEVQRLMQANKVHGLGVALIRKGRIVFVGSYGQRNAAGAPLTPDTVMYGASLTKATFAYLVMQLVDEGKLDLDKSIADYLPKPLPDYPRYADLKDDPRWRKLTLRILLNHSTGFANFRWLDPDEKLRFHRDPGARYGYSGEGINLAQLVIEQGLGLDLKAEMQRRIFDRFAMTRTSMQWREDFAANLADGFTEDGKAIAHDQRENVRAAGSMDTTLSDWSRYLAAAVRGEGLSKAARAEMVRRSIHIDSPVQFPTLLEAKTDRWKAIRLGYAVGWGTFESRYGHAFFKEGHDDGTSNYALCIDARQDCILLLSNDNRVQGIFVALVDRLLGPVNLPWEWESYRPYDLKP
ncbi:beta-lactamase family protein [Sphingomonas sp. JC676]|uniref:serine hydrolase domain-containing protein n=1 Tax=Sphingomonas sp. JC676 TaxID=2768065 RepID=UPI0016576D3A|nr:serine hydrolase domain-containing protein [Sphingomonas sp. JC676]MBC9034118.1 beta-lactamase family protein [Sphingomonas sp. JC676]